jgi:formiminotetrahydrofolate cyclodeaminase
MVFSLTKNIDTNIYKLKTDSIISILKQKYIQDMVIFQNYLNALKMPKETNEEKEKRSKIIQESLMQACEIPLEISEICLNILNIAQDCYKI